MHFSYLLLFLLLATAMGMSVRTGKLTIAGAGVGGLIGFLLFVGAGFWGIAMIGTFFMLGVAATSWKIEEKQARHLAEKDKGKRTAGQVIANGGVAALTGLLVYIWPQQTSLFRLMMAASLAAATADTLSSELGVIYGRRFYNIVTLQKDQRGLDGVISSEGTLIGMAGSAAIALIYAAGFEWNVNTAWIIVAGTAGNLSDSFLGATLERKQYIGNNTVNFLNTLVAALFALLLYLFG